MIPPLEDGVLPDGVHDRTFEEMTGAFGQIQRSDRRIRLTAKMKDHLDEARRSGLVLAVIVDGSYTTARNEPDDIDMIVVLKPDLAWESLRPFEYNAVSNRMIRQMYRFDVFAYPEGSVEYDKYLELFQHVRLYVEYTNEKRRAEDPAMTEEQLDAAIRRTNEAIALMCSSFVATARDRARYKNYYPMIASQSVSEIFKLRKEIDDMIGLTDYVAEFGVPMTNEEIDALADAGSLHPDANGRSSPVGEPTSALS